MKLLRPTLKPDTLRYERVRCMTLTKRMMNLNWTSQTQHTCPSYYVSWCDTAPERCSSGTEASRIGGLKKILSTHEHVSEQLLPFLGLSSVFSEHCWPLSLQSAPSPNSTQPSCNVSVSGCGKEGNKTKNDRMDRYGDRWGKIINFLWKCNGDKFSSYVMLWWISRKMWSRLSCTSIELLCAHPWQRRMLSEMFLKAQMLLRIQTGKTKVYTMCCFWRQSCTIFKKYSLFIFVMLLLFFFTFNWL